MADGIRKIHYQKTDAERDMEMLSNIAKSHYRTASREVQAMANDFFKSMDTDGDKGVDLEEFLTFVRERGYSQMHNNQFFKMLDANGNGRLGFWDVMTLYYIIKSGRPFCNCCADFIPGIYFSCVDCFNDAKTSYNICYTCYRSDKSRHKHNGSCGLFLDNYTLLQAKRERNRTHSSSATNYMKNEATAIVHHSTSLRTPLAASHGTSLETKFADPHSHNQKGESSSQALVRASITMNLAANAFKVLEGAITTANLSATFCTIL